MRFISGLNWTNFGRIIMWLFLSGCSFQSIRLTLSLNQSPRACTNTHTGTNTHTHMHQHTHTHTHTHTHRHQHTHTHTHRVNGIAWRGGECVCWSNPARETVPDKRCSIRKSSDQASACAQEGDRERKYQKRSAAEQKLNRRHGPQNNNNVH